MGAPSREPGCGQGTSTGYRGPRAPLHAGVERGTVDCLDRIGVVRSPPMRLALAAAVLTIGVGPGWAEDAAVDADPDYLERYACVDQLSAANLDRGSVVLAGDIADKCLAEFLARHRSAYRVVDVKRAADEAPDGVAIDSMGRVPGISDLGMGGFLTLRVEEDFDCRSVHPGSDEMICNEPIDKAWIDGNWPWWQKEFGGTRAEYDQSQLGFLLKSQERRRRLLDLAARQR